MSTGQRTPTDDGEGFGLFDNPQTRPTTSQPPPPTTPVMTSKLATLKLQEPLKGSENWGVWKILLEDWMVVNEVYGYVDSENPLSVQVIENRFEDPPVTKENEQTWAKMDRQVLATMRRWVDPTVM